MLHKNSQLGAMGVLIAGLTGVLAGSLSAQEQANPFTAVPDVRAGQQLFARQCSICHGVGATGGENGPDLTTGDFQHASTDAGLFNVISEGVPDTPMIGINRTRTDQSVWQIVAYLRSVSGGERVAVAFGTCPNSDVRNSIPRTVCSRLLEPMVAPWNASSNPASTSRLTKVRYSGSWSV